MKGAKPESGRGDWQVDIWERHGGQYARLREQDLVSSDENEVKCMAAQAASRVLLNISFQYR